MSSDEIAVIRTFVHEFEANVALAQLQAAGIQALVVSGSPAGAAPTAPQGFGLAVHRRDADRAVELLTPPPSPA